MLPGVHRMRRSRDFAETIKHGRRAGRPRLVVHLTMSPGSPGSPPAAGPHERKDGAPALVGFVVSRAVGNSVVRHHVSRLLRHVMRERLAGLPTGSRIVVRATPAAATASSAELAADVDAVLRRVLR